MVQTSKKHLAESSGFKWVHSFLGFKCNPIFTNYSNYSMVRTRSLSYEHRSCLSLLWDKIFLALLDLWLLFLLGVLHGNQPSPLIAVYSWEQGDKNDALCPAGSCARYPVSVSKLR